MDEKLNQVNVLLKRDNRKLYIKNGVLFAVSLETGYYWTVSSSEKDINYVINTLLGSK